MRILIVTPLLPPEPGGPSYYTVALKEAFERSGNHVDVLAFRDVRRYPSGVRHLMLCWKVYQASRQAEVVVALDTVSVALPSVIAARLRGRPIVLRTGGDFVWESFIERTGELVPLSRFYKANRPLSYKERLLMLLQRRVVFPLTTRLVFSTQWQRDLWHTPYALREGKTTVIENAYPSVTLLPCALDERRTEFVWVGRDLVLKNRPTLRAAFEGVRLRHPEYELVELMGVPQAQAHARIRTARCFVLPSISEVSPNLVYEALMLGTPVIATEETGITTGLEGRVYFIDPLNQSALEAALEEMINPSSQERWLHGAAFDAPPRNYDAVATDFITLFRALV